MPEQKARQIVRVNNTKKKQNKNYVASENQNVLDIEFFKHSTNPI